MRDAQVAGGTTARATCVSTGHRERHDDEKSEDGAGGSQQDAAMYVPAGAVRAARRHRVDDAEADQQQAGRRSRTAR